MGGTGGVFFYPFVICDTLVVDQVGDVFCWEFSLN